MDGCFSFNLHGKGYVGGGSNGSHFYQYDTAANTWNLKGNAPGNKIRGFAYSFVVNGKGYAGGGDTTGSSTICADMWMYNDTTNTWIQKSSFPGGIRDAGFSFVINDTAYAGGGYDGTNVRDDFYKYNPFTDTWTPLAPLSMGTVGFPAIFVINNKAYMATGLIGPTESTGLWEYNPASDTWTAKADFPGAARETAFGFTINDYGYVGGGMSNYDTVFTDVWRYNTATDVWTSVQSFPSNYPAWSSAFTVGNTAYVGTGSRFSGSSLVGTDSFKRYRGSPNTTGISKINSSHEFEIYPNPANDFITVKGNIEPNSIISVNDITGREVKIFNGATKGLFIGDLQKGLYLVKCVTGSGTYTVKFIRE